MRKKGQALGIGGAVGFAVIMVVLVVTTSLGGDVVEQIKSQQCTIINNATFNGCEPGTATNASEISDDGLSGIMNFANQFGLIGLVAGISIVLLLIIGVFVVIRRSTGGI